jgi:uncharacterized membrane protein YjfL (UPF0719 family)
VRIGQYYELPGLSDFALAGLKLLVFTAFIVLAWSLINKITSFDDHHALFEEHNTAYALQRGGLVLGQAIGLSSLIATRSNNELADFAWLIGGGIWVTGLVLLLRVLLTKLIPFRLDAGHRTVSVGLARGAFYVAGGLVIGAGLAGSAPSLRTALTSTVVFTALGLAVLVGVYLLNGMVPPYLLSARVRDGSVSAAMIAGGYLIAFGLVLHNAIAGDFHGWLSGLTGFAVTAIVAMVVFYLLCFAVDRWVITNTTLTQVVEGGHELAAAILAVALVSIAVGVSTIAV